MHTGGSAGQPAPTATGTVTGHSYTAAYRYQLVIGKVGGWAIPYPLTIPQAVTGLSAVVLAMVTASWWYPHTGIGGALGVVVLPIVGIRVISRIRPEGRSVSDWLYGWGVAQGHGLTGRGVRLHVGLAAPAGGLGSVPALSSADGGSVEGGPVDGGLAEGGLLEGGSPGAVRAAALAGGTRVPDELGVPSAFPRGASGSRRLPGHHQPGRQAGRRVAPARPPASTGLAGLVASILPGTSPRPGQPKAGALAQPKARSTRAVTPARLTRPVSAPRPRRSTGRQSGWSALTRFFSKPTPAPAPARVPVFDPWGVTPAQGGM